MHLITACRRAKIGCSLTFRRNNKNVSANKGAKGGAGSLEATKKLSNKTKSSVYSVHQITKSIVFT